MEHFGGIGKLLILSGIVLVIAGLAFTFLDKFGFGRLPGDIVYRKGNFGFYFPIVSSILISIIITIILNIFFRK